MTKYIVHCILILCLAACGTKVEISTKKNYEALVLPDGSQVYLNHNSTISYEKEFSPRTVQLTGEAFFNVVPDESIFNVSTQYGDVDVLGTEFNVKTTSKQITVDVKKGLIELKTAFYTSKIKKGMKVIYKDGEQSVKQIKSNKEYRKWMNSLQKELKKLGKELKPTLKEIGNEFKNAGKELRKDFKK